jgi:hypothetical protein
MNDQPRPESAEHRRQHIQVVPIDVDDEEVRLGGHVAPCEKVRDVRLVDIDGLDVEVSARHHIAGLGSECGITLDPEP